MKLTASNYACVRAMCENLNTNGDDIAEVWNDLRDACRRAFRYDDLTARQLDVLADYGVRLLIKLGKL